MKNYQKKPKNLIMKLISIDITFFEKFNILLLVKFAQIINKYTKLKAYICLYNLY